VLVSFERLESWKAMLIAGGAAARHIIERPSCKVVFGWAAGGQFIARSG
jgi:hypothetical protein